MLTTTHLHLALRLRMSGATLSPHPPICLHGVDREKLGTYLCTEGSIKGDVENQPSGLL